jgi:hypothetical protein
MYNNFADFFLLTANSDHMSLNKRYNSFTCTVVQFEKMITFGTEEITRVAGSTITRLSERIVTTVRSLKVILTFALGRRQWRTNCEG